jgi:hypothetical protein
MKKKIKSTPPEPPLSLNMPFDEALKRFIATKPEELEESIKRSKKETAAEREKEVPIRRRS